MQHDADSTRDNRRTALIIEDHPEQAELLGRIVQMRDYRPILATDGETGLRLAKEIMPNVVLLDLMLPGINGFDVCSRLRADRATMLTPVVMLTALGDTRGYGFRMGANEYLTKPYGVDTLFNAISAAEAWKIRMEQRALEGQIHVALNTDIALFKELNDFCALICLSTPLTGTLILQLRQAIVEMAHKAVESVSLDESDRQLDVAYRIYNDRLEIVLWDQAAEFDRLQSPVAASSDYPLTFRDIGEKLAWIPIEDERPNNSA
jgi:CheY-like chemotaxis protein